MACFYFTLWLGDGTSYYELSLWWTPKFRSIVTLKYKRWCMFVIKFFLVRFTRFAFHCTKSYKVVENMLKGQDLSILFTFNSDCPLTAISIMSIWFRIWTSFARIGRKTKSVSFLEQYRISAKTNGLCIPKKSEGVIELSWVISLHFSVWLHYL